MPDNDVVIKTSQKIEDAIDRTSQLSETEANPLQSFAWNLVKVSDGLAPWWSRQRDIELRTLWKDGGYLSSVMFSAVSKITNIPIRVEAVNPNIVSHVAQAEEFTYRLSNASEFGAGLYETMLKFNADWLGQDNGGFMEIIGDGPKNGPIVGPVLAVRHLDSGQCTRTGNSVHPVLVQEGGKMYSLHRTRVVFSSQLPSARADMNGVGYCAVSRSIAIANDLLAMLHYKAEKMGARPANRLLIGNNITGQEIMTAMAAADAIMTELGLEYYSKVVALGGQDVSVNSIDLNSFDPFDEKTQTLYDMYILALAFGLEPSEVFPMGATTSRASETVSIQRARGKLPETYRRSVEQQMSYKVLPPHLRLVMEFKDDVADRERAVTNDIRARTNERNLKSGATTKTVERQRLSIEGVITRNQLWQMNLENYLLIDGSPVASLYYNQKYEQLLVIPRSYLIIEDNLENAHDVLADITANEQLCYIVMNGSTAQKKMALEALAALRWLRQQYMDVSQTNSAQPEDAPEPQQPVNLEDGGRVDET